MNADDAIKVINQVIAPECLTDTQVLIFRAAWERQTYQSLAIETGYQEAYLRGVGAQLWQQLRSVLNRNISKSTVRIVVQQYARGLGQSRAVNLLQDQVNSTSRSGVDLPQAIAVPMLLPDTPVAINSPLYIERPPIESQCYDEILQPGALIRLRAPRQMGKTSLKDRILQHAIAQQYQIIDLSCNQFEADRFSDVPQFMRCFYANITKQLNLENRLDSYWDDDIGAIVSSTIYMQHHILPTVSTALVLAIDDVHRLFECPPVAQCFFPLLRSWYEEGRSSSIWRKLRLLVVNSTEIYVPLNIHQSPFNVGLAVRLPEFNAAQVEQLAALHGMEWQPGRESQMLIRCLGGHPYRIRLALYHLTQGTVTLPELIHAAAERGGIFQGYLRSLLALIQAEPELQLILREIVNLGQVAQADPLLLYKLESMGLIRITGNVAELTCDLFYRFFRSCF